MCLSVSYISHDIDHNCIPDCSCCTAQSTRTLQSRFHLVRSSTIVFHCLSASFAFSQTRCHYRYLVRVCTTTTIGLHCQYNDSAVYTTFPQRFTPKKTDKFGVWISLLHLFCDVCNESSLQRPRLLNQLSSKDSHLAKLLGRSHM